MKKQKPTPVGDSDIRQLFELAPDPKIDRPIFLLGAARSGTSVFFRLLGCHPDLAWYSRYSHRVPRLPAVAFLSRVRDLPFLGDRLPLNRRFIPRPGEGYNILNYATDRVFTSPRRLSADDVTEEAINKMRASVRAHLRWQGKRRFVNKHTGFPRIRYLLRIFPDARFIHIARDGRAVAYSLTQVGFFDGTPDSWWWGDMKPEYTAEYQESGQNPLVLAAIIWKTLMEYHEEDRSELPEDRFLEIRYDEFISTPADTWKKVLAFCDLSPHPRFFRRVSRVNLRSADYKWRTSLSQSDQKLLQASLEGHLERYGMLR